ncbi:hypothetical protein F8M41_018459 [Gigaspora margarita]|uniref:Uncharacterized protein n=1 Tax=Gigaspora margarita TaxID=4874 RepID=A0A8H4ELE0_GIGMA|nr:hypothetical protein F8M41_018459 [Gigaspora margarita]
MISMIIIDQDNYPIFQYGSEDISDDILEYNSIPIALLESFSFLCHLEHVTTISNPEYSNVSIYASNPVSVILTKSSSSHNLEHFILSSSSHNLECFILLSPSHNPEPFTSSSSIECSDPLLYTSEYSTLLYYSNQSTSPLDNFKNFTSLSDNLNDSDSLNTLLQNTKKHKSVFVVSSTNKPKPGKSWVWDYMRKDKTIKKETKCLVLVE